MICRLDSDSTARSKKRAFYDHREEFFGRSNQLGTLMSIIYDPELHFDVVSMLNREIFLKQKASLVDVKS